MRVSEFEKILEYGAVSPLRASMHLTGCLNNVSGLEDMEVDEIFVKDGSLVIKADPGGAGFRCQEVLEDLQAANLPRDMPVVLAFDEDALHRRQKFGSPAPEFTSAPISEISRGYWDTTLIAKASR